LQQQRLRPYGFCRLSAFPRPCKPTEAQRPALDELRTASANGHQYPQRPVAQKTCRARPPAGWRQWRTGCKMMLASGADDAAAARTLLPAAK
jgi:hypothetical protein